MKRLFFMMTVFILFSSSVLASKEPVDCDSLDLSTTTESYYHEHCYKDKDTDTHPDKEDPKGVGADVILWESSNKDSLIENMFAEYRYDIENKGHSIFGVFTINLFKKVKDFFNGDN